jgi:hypothetical protein
VGEGSRCKCSLSKGMDPTLRSASPKTGFA